MRRLHPLEDNLQQMGHMALYPSLVHPSLAYPLVVHQIGKQYGLREGFEAY